MSAPDARRRSDDAVRRIRAESERRIDGQRRRRAFSSWCALAMLAGGISLAALDAHEVRRRERVQFASMRQALELERAKAAAMADEQRERVAEACAKRDEALAAADKLLAIELSWGRSESEVAAMRAEGEAVKGWVIKGAAQKGCFAWTTR